MTVNHDVLSHLCKNALASLSIVLVSQFKEKSFFLSVIAKSGLLELVETWIRKFCVRRDYIPEALQPHGGHDCRPGEYI